MSGRGNRGRGQAPPNDGRGNQPSRGGGGGRGGNVQPISPVSDFPPMPQAAAAAARLSADVERKLTFQPSSSTQQRGPAPQRPAIPQQGPMPQRQASQQQGPPPPRPAVQQQGPMHPRKATQQQGPPPPRPAIQQQGPAPPRPAIQQQGPARPQPAIQQQGPAPPRPAPQPQGLAPARPATQQHGPVAARPAPELQAPAAVSGPSTNQQAVVAQTQAPVSSKSVRPPQRPGFGTIGRKVVVRANHFLVQVADIDINHYDVSISPEVLSKRVCREIMQKLVDSFGASHLGKKRLAYDGRKSCYTAGELPFTSKDFVVKLEDPRRDRQFKVSIKHVSKTDMHHLQQFMQRKQHDCPYETLQSLDVVLRQQPSSVYTVIGRSFFDPELAPWGELGNGVKYWKGFYQSLRPSQMGLSLNIDMSARPFYEPILVSEFVCKYINRDVSRPLSDQDRLQVKRALKGVRVEVNYSGHIRRHKITGVSTEPSQQLMFSLDESGKTVSVVQYYLETYRIVLKYPHLPAIQAGSSTKSMYLPMELCRIVDGQRYTKKLNDRQVTALLRATCQRPSERQTSIEQMVKHNNYNKQQLVQDFGITVDPQLTLVDARILPPPLVKYHESGRKKSIEPSVGQWNMIDMKMINGGTVDFWTCINFSSRLNPNDVDRFCHELICMCTSRGMVFNPNPLIPFRQGKSHQIEKTLTDLHTDSSKQLTSKNVKDKHLQLLIIILPDFSGSYGTIKRVCETKLGIVSQCCQPRQVPQCNKQYLENVSLKINVKVGGRNSALVPALNGKLFFGLERPTIVFGADVTHPQPGEDTSASIAAVVASMDWPEVTKYRGLVSAQAHREEIIQDLYNEKHDSVRGVVRGGMIREHLIAFFKSTRNKPHRIIFYRDGVSEGQFSQVLLHEVDAIRKACASLEDGYQPPITFVVVQKRHNTRLFPARQGDRQTTDKSGNIMPGTVIDTKICHPREFDFYLCSHAGIKGTSRPAHYHVLYDENNFSADHLQNLTNSLCYTYARCTRSVSIVPPAYYAHLAASRARYYAEGLDISDSSSTSAVAGGGAATRERDVLVQALPMVKENVKEVMFYC